MWNLMKHEVMYYIRNKKDLFELIILIVSLNLLFSFALPNSLTVKNEVFIATFWVSLVAGCFLSAAAMFERDSQAGRLELLSMLPCGLERALVVKYLAFTLLLFAAIAAVTPLTLLNMYVERPGQWLLGLGVASLSLTAITYVTASFTSGTGKGAAFLGLISMPLIVPVIIFGAAYVRQPELWHETLLFLIAYAMIAVPIACLAAASSIRASF